MNRAVSPQTRAKWFGTVGAVVLLVGILATAAPSAPADAIKPLIVLGPTTVANGTVVISGSVGLPSSSVQLTINGQPVSLDVQGRFAAIVNLNGQSKLTLVIRNLLSGDTVTTEVPVTGTLLGPGGLLASDVLSLLEHAGVQLEKPLGGFKVLDGLPLEIHGSVLDSNDLAGLEINGVDVLSLLGPGGGGFTVELPGTTKVIHITMVDRQGVSQNTTLPVEHVSTPAGAAAAPVGRSVNVRSAVGLRIASVRYRIRNVKRTKRLRVIVTVKDRRGLLVRNAAVGVRSARVRAITRNPRVKRTNRVGQSAFLLTVRNRSFGKRLVLRIVAKAPQAKTRKTSAVRLPRLTRTAAAQPR